ncbi:MAG: sigma-70 family RNA polymerase sigma factor [Oscillospiraceae bacterium]
MNSEKSAFVERNLGLVHLCANRFRSRGIEYDDLYSAGCIGLMKATKAFDENRGVAFSTYAVPVILGEIKRLFRDGGTIKVSRGIKELSMRASRARETFVKENGHEPLISELSAILQMPEEDVVEAISAGQPPLSLTSNFDDDEASETDIPVEGIELKIGDLISLKQVMSDLEPKDRQLLWYRYFKNMTQTETARVLNMTQVQVSRREKKLLGEMRELLLE